MKLGPFAAVAALAAALTAALFKLLSLAPIMPVAAAREAVIVDEAYATMLAVTVPVYALVAAAVLYSLFAFRAKDPSEQGVKFDHSRGRVAESVWLAASLVLTLGLAAYGAREVRHLRGGDAADLDVEVRAEQFSWEFYYPALDQYGSRLTLPKGRRVRLLLRSKDVVHSFWVPEFRVKQDVVPGKIVTMLLTPTRTGDYRLLCAELCGADHTEMTAWVTVVEPEEFDRAMQGDSW